MQVTVRDIAIAGLALLGIKYFSNRATGARYLTGVRMQIQSVVPVGVKDLQITFNVDNPNTKDAIVKSVVGDVYVNNTKVARVNTFSQVTIKGNASSIYPVKATLNVARAFQSIAELTKGVAGSIVRFVGTANINDVASPINVEYRL